MSRLGPISLNRIGALPADVVRALGMIPEIVENTREMAQHTARLESVAGDVRILETMDARMAAIEQAMPVLVEVQRHLAQLPETMGALDGALERISDLVERIEVTLDTLNVSVQALQGALEPMGRLASRVPGQRKGAESD